MAFASSSSSSAPVASTSSTPFPPSSSSTSASAIPSSSSSASAAVRPPAKSKAKSHTTSSRTGIATGRTCEATDRFDKRCRETVMSGASTGKGKGLAGVGAEGRRWCATHDMEQKVVVSDYGRCVKELYTITVPSLPTPTITACSEISKLGEWEKKYRFKWALVTDALAGRKYWLDHFAGRDTTPAANGGALNMNGDGGEGAKEQKSPLREYYEDNGPVGTNVEERKLRKIRDEVGVMLTRLIDRAHLLLLTSEDALWLLPLRNPSPGSPGSTPHPPCSSSGSSSHLRPPTAPPLASESTEPNPVVALASQKRSELLELLSLMGSHASFIKEGRKSVERVRIVECLFRRLIVRDRELLFKAYVSGHDHVLRFFEDAECCSLESLIRLWDALQAADVLVIKESICDAFRAIKWEESGAGDTEEGEAGLGLQLLGGWTYKIQLAGPMGWREWMHLYDLCSCPGCALRCCTTFHEFTRIRRLTVVPHGKQPAPFLYWGDAKESDASRIFKSFDVVRCSEERRGCESEIRRVGGGFVGSKGKGVFVERQERGWGFFKIPIDHPKALPILRALEPHYVVVTRPVPSLVSPFASYTSTLVSPLPLPPPSHLWLSRHRSAPSKADLRHHSWLTDPDAFGPSNSDPLSIFANLSCPETEQKMEPFKDVWEVLILDGFGRAGEGSGRTAKDHVGRSYEQFEAEVGQTLLAAMGCRDVKAALEWGEAESYRRGDLLSDFMGGGNVNGNGKKGPVEKVKGEGAVEASKEKGKGKLTVGKGEISRRLEKKGGGTEKLSASAATSAALLESLRDDSLAFSLSRSLFK